jgi:hypothetical protein
MSEYQYYEFQTIDKPLSEKDIEDLGDLSSRARITSTSFVNEYNYGSFKGKPLNLVEKYFDAFLYVANWGTRWLMLKVPRNVIDVDLAAQYCTGESVVIHEKGDHLIFEFTSETEDYEWEEGEGWLSSLISLRSDIIGGDYRSLYLAWLYGAQMDNMETDELEPPVPSNLVDLNGPLKSFANFMRIDTDLIAVAAEKSVSENRQTDPKALRAWIQYLSESEKNDILLRLIEAPSPHLGTQLMQRFKQTLSGKGTSSSARERRTVEHLLESAESYAEDRKRKIAEQKAKERERKKRAEAIAREKYLDSLVGREKKMWIEIENLIETRQPTKYDEAVKLLKDLHDLNKKRNRVGIFREKLKIIRQNHIRKPSLLDRLRKAGLDDG